MRSVKDESPVFVINVFLFGAFDLKLSNSLQLLLARGFFCQDYLYQNMFSLNFGQECYVTKSFFVSELSLCWQYVCIFFGTILPITE